MSLYAESIIGGGSQIGGLASLRAPSLSGAGSVHGAPSVHGAASVHSAHTAHSMHSAASAASLHATATIAHSFMNMQVCSPLQRLLSYCPPILLLRVFFGPWKAKYIYYIPCVPAPMGFQVQTWLGEKQCSCAH